MSARRQSKLFRLVAALIVLAVFVTLVEIGVRVSGVDDYFQNRFFVLNRALDYPDVFKKDRQLFWRFRTERNVTSRFFEGRSYRINSRGLRGGEVSRTKTKRRILTLGNSCTFGWAVTDQQTYSNQLEMMLDGEYEVINAGIPGYSTVQGLRFLEQELLELDPDIVTIMFAWNDHWVAADGIADEEQQFPPQILLSCQNQLSKLHSYRLLKKLLLSQLEAHPDSTWDRDSIVYRVSHQGFARNLLAICRLCIDRGITPILLTSPAPSLDRYGHNRGWAPVVRFHQVYCWQTRQVATALDVDMIDAEMELNVHEGMYDDTRHDFIHFNAAGHRIIAGLLADKVRQLETRTATGQ
ncbi:MAG: GDSL-type esterase/lipase family protein [candidate division Zixibacteria bacterium]|nr:GDSL-type esterase/lipase family protein [candidate division Zixibacteria bacterium]MDH3937651.1 GDSL-type esterase/lipase family protein [candidate division Zixibacteria bacterium]MDH4032660.1 GDSL-type esterase/lipase family protein [candidate division Zixibacteria bacterium]